MRPPPSAAKITAAQMHLEAMIARLGPATNRNCSAWIKEMQNGISTPGMQVFSQFSQDGVLQLLFAKLGTTNRFFVEFGFGYEGRNLSEAVMNSAGAGLNTRLLASQGWKGRYFDALISSAEFNITQAILTPQNIVSVFQRAAVPTDLDYLSIDVDSIDLWLMKSVLAPTSPFRPRVLSVEFNANFPASSHFTFHDKWVAWAGRKIYGASVGALNFIARLSDYTAVHVGHIGDVFFVRQDVLHAACDTESIPGIRNLARHLPVPNAQGRCIRADLDRVLDISTFFKTTNSSRLSLARKHAIVEMHKLTQEANNHYKHQLCRPSAFHCNDRVIHKSQLNFNKSSGLLSSC